MSRTANDGVERFPTRTQSIADVLKQIEAEYREMPGLSVREAQAQRLWGLDNTVAVAERTSTPDLVYDDGAF
jgi:hypothetical protein